MHDKPIILAVTFLTGNTGIIALLTLTELNLVVKLIIGILTIIFTAIQITIALRNLFSKDDNGNKSNRIKHSPAYQEVEKK